MRVTRKIHTVRGAPMFRLPSDAGFLCGRIYRLTMIKFDGSVEIKGPSLARKKYLHETAYNGFVYVDRSTIRGMKDGPTIRLFPGMADGEVEVDYEPGAKKVVLRVVRKQKP